MKFVDLTTWLLIVALSCVGVVAAGDEPVPVSQTAEERAVAKLAGLLKDEDVLKSAQAAKDLAQLGDGAKAAIPQLIEALSDERRTEEFNGAPVPIRCVANFAAEALIKIGPAAAPALAQSLQNKDEDFRRLVVTTLREIGNSAQAALPSLKTVVEQDEDEWVRVAAIYAYTDICRDNPERLAVLTKAAEDRSSEVRGAALSQLGELGPDAAAAIPVLLRALTDKKTRAVAISSDMSTRRAIRYDAVETLGRIGAGAKPARDTLIGMMRDKEDGEAQLIAALALIRIDNGNQEALQVLIAALKDDRREAENPKVAARLLAQLGSLATPAFKALTEALKHEDNLVRSSAAQALYAIGGKDAIPSLRMLLSDKDWIVSETAAQMLGKLGPLSTDAVPDLIKALRAKSEDGAGDWFVHGAIAQALGEIGPGAKGAIPELSRLAKADEKDADYDAILAEIAAEAIQKIESRK